MRPQHQGRVWVAVTTSAGTAPASAPNAAARTAMISQHAGSRVSNDQSRTCHGHPARRAKNSRQTSSMKSSLDAAHVTNSAHVASFISATLETRLKFSINE